MLGAIHVATDEGGGLRYAGSVGTGFSEKAAREMKARLDTMTQPRPAVVGLKLKGAVWCRPEVRVEVAYRDVTREGLLLHASFNGVRHLGNARRIKGQKL